MEHVVTAERNGVVEEVVVAIGTAVGQGEPLLTLAPAAGAMATVGADDEAAEADAVGARADLAAVSDRHERTRDDHRTDAVARRHGAGRRTARENIADLVDEGSFLEYGPLVVAAQRGRRSLEELIERTPADGLVGGVGTVDGRSVVAMSYDYTVLAGTQGLLGHEKKDRLFELAERRRLPVVFFTEGGGGRPGDTDGLAVSGLDTLAFYLFARLSGLVPLIGIASGYCFAGNAAILGCCDVVIGVTGTNIAMGGPAMIEGGGLGTYEPTEIGPFDVQVANGVIDIAADDDADAVTVGEAVPLVLQRGRGGLVLRRPGPAAPSRAREPLACVRRPCRDRRDVRPRFRARAPPGLGTGDRDVLGEGRGPATGCRRQRPRSSRRRDRCRRGRQGSTLPAAVRRLRPARALPVRHARIHGRARARGSCGAVRHVTRLFVTGANLTVPFGTIVLRKGYGLGAQAMAGGSFKAPEFCVSWPTGEFGGMNLEGAVRLSHARSSPRSRTRRNGSARSARWWSVSTRPARR